MKLVLTVLAVGDVTPPPVWVVVLVVVAVVIQYNRNTWPKCKRSWAMKKTGKSDSIGEEVKCKYCGDRHSRESWKP